MPYANIEDRRRRSRERYAERRDEYRAYFNAHAAIRMQDPAKRARRNQTAAEWKARTKAVADAYKLERGCADCGYNKESVALDFDHVRGKKEFAIADIKAIGKLMKEIAKCDVVCANCHRVRTRDRRKRD